MSDIRRAASRGAWAVCLALGGLAPALWAGSRGVDLKAELGSATLAADVEILRYTPEGVQFRRQDAPAATLTARYWGADAGWLPRVNPQLDFTQEVLTGEWPPTGSKVLIVLDQDQAVSLFAWRNGADYRFWSPWMTESVAVFRCEPPARPLPGRVAAMGPHWDGCLVPASELDALTSAGRRDHREDMAPRPPTAAVPDAGHAPAQDYLTLETFAAWKRLSPALGQAQVCSLAPAGHALWEAGQLRLPDPSLRGDFNGDGVDDRAIRLRTTGAGPCDHVVLVTKRSASWTLLHLQRVDVGDRPGAGDLVWDADRRAIGITTGQTERFTRPATMWSNGTRGGGSAGYVIDVILVDQTIQWNPSLQRFEYARLAVPWNVAAPEELELLRRDGRL